MKKILVTGATGFIGPYVIRELLSKSHQVIATSLSEEKARLQPWYKEVSYVPFDLASNFEGNDLYQHFGQPDLLIHLAWEGLPNYKAAFHLEENLPRHYRFLANLLHNGLDDVTITGTCFEYGMKEGLLEEEMPADPANPYAMAKDRLRIQLEKSQADKPFTFKWARLFYMFGKGQNANSLLSQLENALEEGKESFNMSGGEQVRDFLPVEQVAAHITAIALQQEVTGVINCCSGIPVTVKQLVENYLKQKQKNIKLNLGFYPYPDYEPMAFWGDNTKLKKIYNG